MSALAWKIAKVISVKQINPTVRSFVLENADASLFEFEAGQFITFDLPISERKSKRARSYSIASAPNEKKQIELIISLANPSEGGSVYLFEKVEAGCELTYRGPSGVFVLPKDIQTDIVFICTGTGVAPFISMLKDLLYHKHVQTHQLTLIFGCRKKEDIIYLDELRKMEIEHANFRYIPTLSQEKWDGAMGYVHLSYQAMKPTLKDNTQFYLCGWRQMVDEAKTNIIAMGFPENSIHYELYG